jgi:hypothetical protein
MNSVDLNGFSVEIVGSNGLVRKVYDMGHTYFAMPHGTEYKLQLGSSRNTRADAHVWIDGEKVGVWRIGPYGQITIERPANVARKFTLLTEGTSDAIGADIVTGNQDNGLVKVVFKPEFKQWSYPLCNEVVYSTNSLESNRSYGIKQNCMLERHQESRQMYDSSSDFASAGTGLGEHSGQRFGQAEPLTSIDDANITTIYARLVVDRGPKYIGRKNIRHTTEIPPRIATESSPRVHRPWYDFFWY